MDWTEFLAHLASLISDVSAATVVRECIAAGDLLTACEIARKALRIPHFNSELLRCFSEKRFQPGEIHNDLVGIDSRVVLTTNVDKLYDTTANAVLHGDVIVKAHSDIDVADVIRRQNRCIIKVHGTIDTPGSTIFTRIDYADARTKHSHFYSVLEALFMTHTFLFLGASMRDPDMALLLEDYSLRYKGSRPHYVVMPEGSLPPQVLDVMEHSMNFQTIPYDSSDNHAQLGLSIKELRIQVEQARMGLLETMDW